MTHLQEKTKKEPKSRAIWWQAALVFLGIFSPILPGSANVAQAQFGTIVDATFGNFFEWMMNLLQYITSVLAALSGQLLDISVDYFVLNMAEKVNSIGAIDGLWQTFRDLGNIAFIGVLLYIAIRTVLNIGNKFSTKQLLIRLVIVALFVNFSLFATKVVIDTSNVVALQFYNAVQVEECGLNTDCNLSHFFADALNLSSIYSDSAIEDSSVRNFELGLVMMLGSMFNLVAAFAMGAMALLLIIRFVVLMLLMIASPLAFIAFALPGADNWGKKWVDKLLSQSFFAPAMLAMVYVTARLAIELQSGIAGAENTDLTEIVLEGSGSDKFGALLVFIIVIGLMLASVIVAKKMGAHGATKAIELGQKARNWGQATVVGAATGAAGAAARGTVGWSARAANERLKKSSIGNTLIGDKLLTQQTEKLAKKDFGSKKNAFQTQQDYKKRLSRKDAAGVREEVRRILESDTSDAEKRRQLSRLSTNEQLDFGKDFLKEHAHLLSEGTLTSAEKSDNYTDREVQEIKESRYNPIMEAARAAAEAGVRRDEEARKEAVGRMKAALGPLSEKEIKENLDIDIQIGDEPEDEAEREKWIETENRNREIIEAMSASQFDNFIKSKSKDEKDKINEVRLQQMKDAMNDALDTSRDTYDPQAVEKYFAGMKKEEVADQIQRYIKQNDVYGLSAEALEEIDDQVMSNLMSNLKSGQQDDLRNRIISTAADPDNRDSTIKIDRAANYLERGPGAAHT